MTLSIRTTDYWPCGSICSLLLVALINFALPIIASSVTANAYVNVPIYLDRNITINHNLNFRNGHQNDSQLNDGTILLSSFHGHLVHQKQSSGVHPPYFVADLARKLDDHLRWIRDHEMEVPTIQRLFDAADRGSTGSNIPAREDTKLVAQFASKLQMKIENAIEVVNETSVKILNLYQSFESKLDLRKMSIDLPSMARDSAVMTEDSDRTIYMETMVFPCDSYEDDLNGPVPQDMSSAADGANVKPHPSDLLNLLSAAGHSLHEHEDLNYTLNSHLLETIKAIDLDVPNFKNAFFLSKDNYGGDSNCRDHYANQQFRYLFTSSIKSKRIFLIIDHGASIANEEQYDLTKSFASDIIDLLNENDQLTIVGVANKVHSFNTFFAEHSEDATKNQLYAATVDIKQYFNKFLDTLNKTKEITNHTLAFDYSFRMVDQILNDARYKCGELAESEPSAAPILMIYVSRGLLSPMTEAKSVLEAIATGQSRLHRPVIINTCAIILDEKRVMYEKQFLSDIAAQNYTKYNIDIDAIHSKIASAARKFVCDGKEVKRPDNWFQNLDSFSQKGKLYLVNKRHANEIIQTATAVVSDVWLRKPFLNQAMRVYLPLFDPLVKDGIIALTQACAERGVFGVNLYLSDLAEDIIFYQNRYEDSYAFLIDTNGMAIWHPSYPRPQAMQGDSLFPTDIQYLEKVEESVRKQWLDELKGKVSVMTEKSDHQEVKTYTWQHVYPFYIVFIVTVLKAPGVNRSPSHSHGHLPLNLMPMHMNTTGQDIVFSNDSITDMMFHRLDLILPTPFLAGQSPKLCNYFKRLSVQETGTLFLSASAFKSPFKFLKNMCDVTVTEINSYKNHQELEECVNKIRSVMAYIKDSTKLLTNPGLQAGVREDVLLLSHAINVLRHRHLQPDRARDLNKYIIRRYVATLSGALQMYPGCVLETNFEPSRRPWFVKALEYPEKIIVTEPYLDAGGAGYIITIAHTIYESTNDGHPDRHRSFHHHRRRRHSNGAPKVAAVVAIDVTRGYFYKLLVQSSALCQDDLNIKCFLIEDAGYLIVHPSILEPSMPISGTQTNNTSGWSSRRPAIIEHITHKESLVSNDMLLHKNLVQKRMCQNLLNRRVERYYKFNTSLTDVLTNVVNGERSKYQITTIQNSNILVVMVNATDGEGGTAFCPCSTVDRVCFNCNRMEPINCECPCECPIMSIDKPIEINDYTFGDADSGEKHVDFAKNIDVCTPPAEQITIRKVETTDNLHLQSCVNVSCEQYVSQFDCLGVIGCEWCQVDVDGDTPLLSPFCTQQLSCFNGILGSLTPYGEGDLAIAIDSMMPSTYATVGPVIGSLFILCLVIAMAMYCYRHNVEPGSEQLYIESIPAEHNFGLPLTRFDYDSLNPNNVTGSDGMDNAIILPSDISPYRMPAGNYRRPHGESDHGYSTMTPHEDSDHVCFTLIEPLISSRRSNMSISDATSINVDSSSPPSHKHSRTMREGYDFCDNGMTSTLIASPHHIQAPVTVHQPMEAS